MIEVMFGESEGGAMKMAKNYIAPDFYNGATAWFGEKPNKEEFDKMFQGEAVGGNSSEVVCIPLMMDIGDINAPIESEYRKNLILDMYTINGIENINSLEFDKVWERYLNEIFRLKNYAYQGKDIRIWYSETPYSICGFYYVCNLLKDYKCKVFGIKLPEYTKLEDNRIQFFSSWGEIESGKFSKFLNLEKELAPCEIVSFALKWLELKEDNSTLRSVVNGKVMGVKEDFYDQFIRKEIPEGEFIMARLIGRVLGKYTIGVGDWWYAKRINKMIEQGEIVVVENQKEIYRRVLKKA